MRWLVAVLVVVALVPGGSAAAADCAPFGGTVTDDTTTVTPRAGLREVTEYLDDGGYRVTTCPPEPADGATTEVHPFATTAGTTLYRPTEDTRLVAPGVWRIVKASYALDADGLATPPATHAPAPRPADRARLAPAPQPRAAARAAPPDDSCTNGAFSRGAARWPNRVSRWQSRRRTYPAGATTLRAIAAGFGGWERTRTSCGYRDQHNIDAIYDGDTTVGWHSVPDGRSVVDFGPTARLSYPCNQGDVLACTTQFVGADHRIREADLRFDAARRWGRPGYDVEAVATHEAGHWLIDLNDLYCACNAWMTMYGYSRPGQLRQRTLARGDVRGMRNAYPG